MTADQAAVFSLAGLLAAEKIGISGRGPLNTLLSPNYKKAQGRTNPSESDNSQTGDIIRTLERLRKTL